MKFRIPTTTTNMCVVSGRDQVVTCLAIAGPCVCRVQSGQTLSSSQHRAALTSSLQSTAILGEKGGYFYSQFDKNFFVLNKRSPQNCGTYFI